MLMHH
jgi:7-keto-8-aminopelargonate synthetase-like enzyme